MQSKISLLALAGMASALYTADTSKPPSGNSIHRPLNEQVPEGKPFTITWTPSTTGKVSIVMLQGPANNVQYLSTIADSIDNTGSFVWNVPSDLPPRTDHYAIEIISEDHSYQYSSQIGLSKDGSSGSVSSSVVTYGSVETAPPNSSAEGTAVCGALDECPASTTTYGSVETAPPSSSAEGTAVCGALDECPKTTTAATGTGNVTSPVVKPTQPMTVPTSLSTVAQPNGPVTKTSVAVVGATGAGSAPKSSAVSSAFAVHGAQLSGVAAFAAGLFGLLAL